MTDDRIARFHHQCVMALGKVFLRLRTCPRCGQLFIKVRKQQYCSPECSQKTRWARFTATRKPRDYHREYLQRMKRRHNGHDRG